MAENSVINALLKGQESTDKLKALLVQHKLPSEVAFFLEEISGVFSEAIAMSQNLAASPELLQNTDESGNPNSSKKRRTQLAPKFGCRKRANPNSCNKVLNKSIDDGFTWRKYGQKEIFSAKHPRSYFRCTHKFDQNCQATRQVQQSDQQADLFEITYFGKHSCKQANKRCEQESSYVINFDSNASKLVQHFSSPALSSIKHEHEEELMSDQTSSDSFTSEQVIRQEVTGPFLPAGDQCDILGLESFPSNYSFSMDPEFDGGASLEFENIESIFSFDEQSIFQL